MPSILRHIAVVHTYYYTDPMCPWSWALEPALRKLSVEFAGGFEVTFVMCGMAREVGDTSHVVSEMLEASDESGMPVDARLWLSAPPRSSHPACLAVRAAAEQGDPAPYLRRLREGLLCRRRKLDTADALIEEGLTADGRVLGTTDYVSPEQALGRPVTGQSDLYSLGVVLYEMLTGEVPFKGENQVAVAMKHVREQIPDVQSKRPEVSAALASVVDAATAKRVEDRYADDAELIADLEDVLAIEAARASRRKRSSWSESVAISRFISLIATWRCRVSSVAR